MAAGVIQWATEQAPVRRVLARGADFTLVEGAGGWRVPLAGQANLSDLPVALGLPWVDGWWSKPGTVTASSVARRSFDRHPTVPASSRRPGAARGDESDVGASNQTFEESDEVFLVSTDSNRLVVGDGESQKLRVTGESPSGRVFVDGADDAKASE